MSQDFFDFHALNNFRSEQILVGLPVLVILIHGIYIEIDIITIVSDLVVFGCCYFRAGE